MAIVLSYLLGAVPAGIVAGRLLKGIDIREYGSGKIGATNVLRTVGVKPAVVVFIFDVAKAAAAVYIARALGDALYVEALAGGAAVAGHNWSIFLRFTGGRGVTPSMGGLFVMAPVWTVVALGAGVLVIAVTRLVSLGSLTGVTVAAVALLALAFTGNEAWEYVGYAGAVGAVIYWQHWDNIHRLLQGRERKLGQGGERRASPEGIGGPE